MFVIQQETNKMKMLVEKKTSTRKKSNNNYKYKVIREQKSWLVAMEIGPSNAYPSWQPYLSPNDSRVDHTEYGNEPENI